MQASIGKIVQLCRLWQFRPKLAISSIVMKEQMEEQMEENAS